MRWLLALLVCTACGDDDGSGGGGGGGGTPDAAVPQGDIRDRLEAIDGLTVEELLPPPADGVRFFQLTYTQPADHAAPEGVTFEQHMTLLHRDESRPLVFALNGYYLDPDPYQEELTAILDCNQLSVEHRFFEPSRPDPADWTLLTIEQSAADHHRIAEAFHPLYPGAWISTGASKGGMTAVYHRRFYPDDVTATVPYVAPIIFGAPDERFLPFFDQVGDETCRQAIHAAQREILVRRDAMKARAESILIPQGYTFDITGLDVAVETSALELEWLFWQYGKASDCDSVPATTASDDDLYDFFDEVASPAWSSDVFIEYFQPFYYQTDAQLGYPDEPKAHVADLLQFQDVAIDYYPEGVTTPTFDPAPMQDIDGWVRAHGDKILFIYGQNDPWVGGRFELGDATDSYVYVAPGRNHGAEIEDLASADRDEVLATLERWTGVTPTFNRTLRPPAPVLDSPPLSHR